MLSLSPPGFRAELTDPELCALPWCETGGNQGQAVRIKLTLARQREALRLQPAMELPGRDDLGAEGFVQHQQILVLRACAETNSDFPEDRGSNSTRGGSGVFSNGVRAFPAARRKPKRTPW